MRYGAWEKEYELDEISRETLEDKRRESLNQMQFIKSLYGNLHAKSLQKLKKLRNNNIKANKQLIKLKIKVKSQLAKVK